jgi:hypothetical protein
MGITDQSSVRAEVTGGGRSGGGSGGGQGSGGGAHGLLVVPRAGGCGFFILALATKTSGRPDASDARTEAFPLILRYMQNIKQFIDDFSVGCMSCLNVCLYAKIEVPQTVGCLWVVALDIIDEVSSIVQL